MAKSRPRKDQSERSDLPCQIIISDIPQFLLGNIRPRDAFRPIARERKYLMDYNSRYPLATTVRTKNWQYNDIKTLRHKDIRKRSALSLCHYVHIVKEVVHTYDMPI